MVKSSLAISTTNPTLPPPGVAHALDLRDANFAVADTAPAPSTRRAPVEDPDRELVERLQAGDEAAFEEIVARHEGRVFRLLFRMMGNREDAEDLTQETFLRLHMHARRFRHESLFSTFVYRVAANAALSRRRSLGRARTRIERLAVRQSAGDELPWTSRCPEDAASGAETSAIVREALAELSPTLRLPIVMYDIEGMAYADIAEALGVAVGTVKSRIHRARKALRVSLAGVLDDGSDRDDAVTAETVNENEEIAHAG